LKMWVFNFNMVDTTYCGHWYRKMIEHMMLKVITLFLNWRVL
jgi:hypothetical protein